jgi:hypothetical protein
VAIAPMLLRRRMSRLMRATAKFVVGVFDTDSSPAWMSSRPMLYLPALPVRRPPAVMGMTRPALRPMARL